MKRSRGSFFNARTFIKEMLNNTFEKLLYGFPSTNNRLQLIRNESLVGGNDLKELCHV